MIMAYYDGTKLLSMTDINGNRPELYLCTTNRTGGKTTYFSRLLVNKFQKAGEKFCLIYRFNYELDDIAQKFFKDINTLFFPSCTMESARKAKGIYHELFIDEKSCGYAISLNSADQLKKYSHLFSDVQRCFFDEFQSETNHYCQNEVEKFISVHTSIARGQGKQTRYVPVYMCSNPVTILNPYYVAMGISDKLLTSTKFFRGNGFVLEQGYVESAANALKESGFSKAFSNSDYIPYSTQAVYLNDKSAFVQKMSGKFKYVATLICNGKEYGLREFTSQGIIYCDDSPDKTSPLKFAVTTEDHNVNFVLLRRNDFFINNLRYLFDKGCFRFRNQMCKDVILKMISYY